MKMSKAELFCIFNEQIIHFKNLHFNVITHKKKL